MAAYQNIGAGGMPRSKLSPMFFPQIKSRIGPRVTPDRMIEPAGVRFRPRTAEPITSDIEPRVPTATFKPQEPTPIFKPREPAAIEPPFEPKAPTPIPTPFEPETPIPTEIPTPFEPETPIPTDPLFDLPTDSLKREQAINKLLTKAGLPERMHIPGFGVISVYRLANSPAIERLRSFQMPARWGGMSALGWIRERYGDESVDLLLRLAELEGRRTGEPQVEPPTPQLT